MINSMTRLIAIAERENDFSQRHKPCYCQAHKDRSYLLAHLALAEKVVQAARRRFEVWDRETYVGLEKAFSDYDVFVKEDK